MEDQKHDEIKTIQLKSMMHYTAIQIQSLGSVRFLFLFLINT